MTAPELTTFRCDQCGVQRDLPMDYNSAARYLFDHGWDLYFVPLTGSTSYYFFCDRCISKTVIYPFAQLSRN